MELVSAPRITLIGEGMVELSQRPDGGWSLGYGGDMLNCAIHLARLGCKSAFASALGSDIVSKQLRKDWRDEGLDVSAVLTDESHQPGLYAISLDEHGERSFVYWRGQSAARRMFALNDSGRIRTAALDGDWLCFSLITLAILPEEGRTALLGLAREMRARGGRVAFDGNYRAGLWDSAGAAADVRNAAIACADIGLPTLDDERALSGSAHAAAVAEHWAKLGCNEVVVKLGADGCYLSDGQYIAPPEQLKPTDTSGAGDAFDAGYLGARLRGLSTAEAAPFGHRLAGWNIMRNGAIPPNDGKAIYPA